MANQNTGCPVWLIKLYGAALYLYPKSFHENYREQMLQVFIDNYRRRQKTNIASFYSNAINDLGSSMSQQHFYSFSQHGRIRIAVAGLFIALGLLSARPVITSALTDGFVSIGNLDQEIDMHLYSDYAEHRLKIAETLLISSDPISVMAGAQSYSELRLDGNLKAQNSVDVKQRVEQALKAAPHDTGAWVTAYTLCAREPKICNAGKTLEHLQKMVPENGITWLYSAAATAEGNDQTARQTFLTKAKDAAFFEDYNNAINARLHMAYVKHPYQLPWYGFLANENHSIAESFVWPIENYSVPGCYDTLKSSANIQILCSDIAKRIALQSGNSLWRKLSATSLAVKLGHSELQSDLDLLKRQNKVYGEAIWTQNIASPGELSEAYAQGRQYEFAVKTIEKYHLLDKTN